MPFSRHIARPAWLVLGLAVTLACPILGCGSGESNQTVQMTPEAEKKTQDMLKGMQNQMRSKYQAKGAPGPRRR